MAINQRRIFQWNDKKGIHSEGDYVLYWMQIHRRIHHNFALEHAVAYANQVDKPLLIFEALKSDYPWGSDRIHQFIMEGMKENATVIREGGFNHFCYLEKEHGQGKGLVRELANRACALITDDFPVFVVRKHNEHLGLWLSHTFYISGRKWNHSVANFSKSSLFCISISAFDAEKLCGSFS